jgi:hypothetical protein
MHTSFVPLAPGEAPGDPELGGWRPLPKSLFQKRTCLSVPPVHMSLEQAVHLINFEFHYLRLLRAIEKVTIGLLQAQNIFTKGGMQCS